MRLTFLPTLEHHEIRRRLDRLLVAGPLDDASLMRRIDRLARSFADYAGSYPLPFWAPGLILTPEMRGLTEALFPMAQVRRIFELLLKNSCRFTPLLDASYLYSSASWLDFLQRHRPQLREADPAATLRLLARDGEARLSFLGALLLPHHYGGSFDRYPQQSQWLEGWLKENAGRIGGRVRALDSACGSGEGTYGLAESIRSAGLDGTGSLVHGSTLEPIELFAGAHAFFPHDAARTREYRERVAPLLAPDSRVALEFFLEDVGAAAQANAYDVILCNGLLGGPLLHEPGELARAIRSLAGRLAPGGVLLAADRFHAGWRLKVPAQELRALLRAQGLEPLEVPEGVAGKRQNV